MQNMQGNMLVLFVSLPLAESCRIALHILHIKSICTKSTYLILKFSVIFTKNRSPSIFRQNCDSDVVRATAATHCAVKREGKLSRATVRRNNMSRGNVRITYLLCLAGELTGAGDRVATSAARTKASRVVAFPGAAAISSASLTRERYEVYVVITNLLREFFYCNS